MSTFLKWSKLRCIIRSRTWDTWKDWSPCRIQLNRELLNVALRIRTVSIFRHLCLHIYLCLLLWMMTLSPRYIFAYGATLWPRSWCFQRKKVPTSQNTCAWTQNSSLTPKPVSAISVVGSPPVMTSHTIDTKGARWLSLRKAMLSSASGQMRAVGKLSSENFQAVNKDSMDAGYSWWDIQ